MLIGRLLEEMADRGLLTGALEDRLTQAPWADVVWDISLVATHELDWMTSGERDWTKHTAIGAIHELLNARWPPSGVKPRELERALGAFTEWLARQGDREVLSFCWKEVKNSRCDFLMRKLREMDRLSGDFSWPSLRLAHALAADVEAMTRWPSDRWEWAAWERDSVPYFKAIAHESYVVRMWAARAIGLLHTHVGTESTTQLLDWIRNLESSSPGVAGSFLCGASWPHDRPVSDIDHNYMRQWFLDCLRVGGNVDLPGIQTLEFYAHEYFCRDADAIREILRMGRTALAIETATEDNSARGVLDEVLQEMAASDNPVVARRIRRYLG